VKRLTAAVLIVAIAMIASAGFAASLHFDPPNPTSRTPITALIFSSGGLGCPSIDPRVTVEGSRVTVAIRRVANICFAVGADFRSHAYIGMLPPGEYDVVLRLDGIDFPPVKLRVANGDFTAQPREVPTSGGTKIKFAFAEEHIFCSDEGYNHDGCQTVVVKVGNVQAPFIATSNGSSVDFYAPGRAPGLADVSIGGDNRDTQAPAALRYYDPAAPPTSDVYDRLLFPTLYNGGGFNGSRWTTEATVVNTSTESVNTACRARPCPGAIPAMSSLRLDKTIGQHRNGYLLWVPYSSVGLIYANETIRQEAGEKPSTAFVPAIAVSDMPRKKTLVLDGIPFDGSHRIQLRMYSISDGWNDRVSAAFFVNGAATPYRSSGEFIIPQEVDEPAYGEVQVKPPEGIGTLRIEIRPGTPFPFWAFVSVTDNVTHEVSVILPR
jgi:hypothetical protein